MMMHISGMVFLPKHSGVMHIYFFTTALLVIRAFLKTKAAIIFYFSHCR